MTCREFVDFLVEYLEGTLPEPRRETFEGHMHECPSCVTYLDTYRETVRLGKAVCADPEGPVPEDVPDPLVRAILAARRGSDAD
ncbi:MAG: zf-HC2 domain-containing protein [Myxococcota bacterium]